MPDLAGTKTHENLKKAFTESASTHLRYLYFAHAADNEGLPEVGDLFRKMAQNETGHSHGHLDFLREVGDPETGLPMGETNLNLRNAAVMETTNKAEEYKRMAESAREDEFLEVSNWFATLARIARAQAKRLEQMSFTLNQGEKAG